VADTTVSTSHAVTAEQFMASVFREYRDKLVTRPYMGMSSEFPIQVNQDLAKKKGDALTFNLVGALSGSGVTGASTLEGAEEAQQYYGHRVEVDQVRNAVRIPWMSEMRPEFSLMGEAKPALTTWLAQTIEAKIFEQLSTINGLTYAAASAAQRNTWMADNSDRVLYGAAVANAVSGVNATALGLVDATTDIFTTTQISLAKRLAQLASPKVRPIRIDNGEEYYVLFAHPLCVRDLKNSSAWQAAQQYAMPRGSDNPIFTGMAGIWDGVIIKETPKVLLLSAVGDSSINVAMNSLCGAQAILFAQAATPKGYIVDMVEEEFDYGDKQGVAIRSVYGIEKAVFKTNSTNPCQHGVVTVFSAAVAD